MRLRISLALAAVVAAVAALTIGVGAAAASVGGGPWMGQSIDPQTSNIPYVAWIGETVKASRCFGFAGGIDEATANTDLGGNAIGNLLPAGTASIVDWSGVNENNAGPVVTNQVTAQLTNSGLCFSFQVTSEKPGLAEIKLNLNNQFIPLLFGGDSLFQTDILVIWLQDQAPTLTEVAGANLGDPQGDGVFNPIPGAGPNGTNAFLPGLLNITVKGTFPLGNDFAGLNHPTVTLPDDWAWLAQNFAEDNSIDGSNYPGAAAMRWDIHDDDATTEGHVSTSFCTDDIVSGSVDAVDNCLGRDGGDADLGPFSNIYGGTDPYAYGPFDPVRGFETLLSDGKLDSGDAPMPALRINVDISSDSTVGSLSKADKSDIYSRDGTGSTTGATPHDLYAPFYKALIPAALPGDGNLLSSYSPATSGVSGQLFPPGDFTGFLDWSGPGSTEATPGIYDYWDTFTRAYSSGYNDCYYANSRRDDPNGIPVPTGITNLAVYTDEHGEAYVQFNPDVGIKLTPDSDGRCDIYDPNNPTVGHATITATSVYPDQVPLWDGNGAGKTSTPLTKTVNFASSKILACIAKSSDEAYCVETILDQEGNPVAGAPVEFSAQAATGSAPVIRADSNKVGSYDTTGQWVDKNSPTGFVDVKTGPNGEAAIDVVSTTGACIDVVSENTATRNGGTGIFRSVDFNPTSGAACGSGSTSGGGGTSNGGGGTNAGGGGTTGAGGAAAAPVVTAAPVAVATPVPTAKTAKPATATKTMTLASARVVKVKKARYLVVRVNGAAKMVRLHITLVSKVHGKTTHRVITRFVRTNHAVRVGHLKLAPSVRSVRVALA